jgi:hypothetical protein
MSANRACSKKPIQRHDAMLPYGKITMLLNNSSAWPSAGKSLVDDVPWYDKFSPRIPAVPVMARILTYITCT